MLPIITRPFAGVALLHTCQRVVFDVMRRLVGKQGYLQRFVWIRLTAAVNSLRLIVSLQPPERLALLP